MTANIDDVALKAGVSKATVSRVFNNSATVSPQTRKRVLSAIQRLDYKPNPHARKLAGGSGAIALVLQESVREFFANPFWIEVVDGFVTAVSKNNQHPALIFHTKEDGHQALINTLRLGNYDAVAFFGWHQDISRLERDIPSGMRVVFGGRQGDSKRFTYVGADNTRGAFLATSHLIEKGCRRILTLTGDLDIESARERLSGYKLALKEFDIKIQNELILQADYSEEGARRVLDEFLTRNIEFDGIFAANDLMALESIRILKELKIPVPNQVKVIGFDDIPKAVNSTPSLSTIHQPSYLLGQNVAEQLLKPASEPLSNIELSVSVLERQSTFSA